MKINLHPNKFLLLLALGTSIIIINASCSKDEKPAVVGNTISDKLVADASFSLLKKAITKAGLIGTLKGTGPFTFFAPDDAAFIASGINSAAIDALSADQLKTILTYHIVAGKFMAADLAAGPNAKVETANTPIDSIFSTKNTNGVFINGFKVITADVTTDNGVIHKIERVLIPAGGTVVQTIMSTSGGDDGLDSLAVATLIADAAYPGLIHTIDSVTLTVFAPTNKAFRNLLSDLSLQSISQIPIYTLLPLLRYHVVGGRVFSSDIINGSLTMSEGGSTITDLTDGTGGIPTITGNGNSGTKADIIKTNILERNGVIHLINLVLKP